MSEREAFEAWHLAKWPTLVMWLERAGTSYTHTTAASCWEAWQARAALDADSAAPAEPRTSERHFALREAHGITAEGAYFEARPDIDNERNRAMFGVGFVRGFDAGEKVYATQPAPAAAPDVDALAQEIRRVDGAHSLGAGALAEKLVDWMRRSAPAATPVQALTDEQDAKRYRWLRDCMWSLDPVMIQKSSDGPYWRRGVMLDRAVDEAMAKDGIGAAANTQGEAT